MIWLGYEKTVVKGNVLITLNKRLATAAAAIVHRIISRSSPRVFRPVLPLKRGSMENASAIVYDQGRSMKLVVDLRNPLRIFKRQISLRRLKIKVFTPGRCRGQSDNCPRTLPYESYSITDGSFSVLRTDTRTTWRI
jgi:hypothetical protein